MYTRALVHSIITTTMKISVITVGDHHDGKRQATPPATAKTPIGQERTASCDAPICNLADREATETPAPPRLLRLSHTVVVVRVPLALPLPLPPPPPLSLPASKAIVLVIRFACDAMLHCNSQYTDSVVGEAGKKKKKKKKKKEKKKKGRLYRYFGALQMAFSARAVDFDLQWLRRNSIVMACGCGCGCCGNNCCGFDCGWGCCCGRWGRGCGGCNLDNYSYDVGPGWHGCGYQGGHPSYCGCAGCGQGGRGGFW
ncbi:hypothetical protein TcWFU_009066 [Taenia crassiceps]|uniref:Uncharacterized protein n=1 Tax=Taenia crassiceps TaxID=6207 RepID=A0ABR4QEH2_9CEST